MTGPAKILAVDDEPDFEALIARLSATHPTKDLEFSFARMEEAPAVLADEVSRICQVGRDRSHS